MRKLVIIPTYNEKENISAMIDKVFSLPEPFEMLVIDDGSPDGTAAIVKERRKEFPERLHLMERAGKLGLGTAYLAGFRWGLENGFDYICEMDCDFSLNTDLRKVLFEKMTIGDISGEMRVAGGALSLERLAMGVFGGRATASGSYSTAADPARPVLKLDAAVSGASFRKTFEELEMVQQLVPIFAKTGGDYSLSLDLGTSLDAAMSPDLRSLNAAGEIKSANIHVQNIEAFDALAKALGNDDLRKIEARDVAIRFSIKDGRITTQPFDLKMGGVNINLAGSTGLDQTIDYKARVAVPGGKTLQSVGVNIGGTFSSPKITLGIREAAEEAVKNVVDEQIQKLTGSESLSEEIAKQAENLRAEAKRAGEKLIAAAQEQRAKLVEAAASKGALARIAAEKGGDKLVQEAEKQAANLEAEVERQIEKLTSKKE